jgi:hypothetical protein
LWPHLYFSTEKNVLFGSIQSDFTKIGMSNLSLTSGISSEIISNEFLKHPNNILELILQSPKSNVSEFLKRIAFKMLDCRTFKNEVFGVVCWLENILKELCSLIEVFAKNHDRSPLIEFISTKNLEWNELVEKTEKKLPELKFLVERIEKEHKDLQILKNQTGMSHSLNIDDDDMIIFKLNIKRCKRIIEGSPNGINKENEKEILELINFIGKTIIPSDLKSIDPNIESLQKNAMVYVKRKQSSKYERILEILNQLMKILEDFEKNIIIEGYKTIEHQEDQYKSELISIRSFIHDIENKEKIQNDKYDDYFFLEVIKGLLNDLGRGKN